MKHSLKDVARLLNEEKAKLVSFTGTITNTNNVNSTQLIELKNRLIELENKLQGIANKSN